MNRNTNYVSTKTKIDPLAPANYGLFLEKEQSCLLKCLLEPHKLASIKGSRKEMQADTLQNEK